MTWQIFTVICFFGISPQPLCVSDGTIPLYFDNKKDCKGAIYQIKKVFNKPLNQRKLLMVMYCEEKEEKQNDTIES